MAFNDETDLEMQIFSCFKRELPELVFEKGDDCATYKGRKTDGWLVLTGSPFDHIVKSGTPRKLKKKSVEVLNV